MDLVSTPLPVCIKLDLYDVNIINPHTWMTTLGYSL